MGDTYKMKLKTLIIAGITLLASAVHARPRTDIPDFLDENDVLTVTIKRLNSKKNPFKATFTFDDGRVVTLDRTLRSRKRRADIIMPEVDKTVRGILTLSGGNKLDPESFTTTIVDSEDADLQGNDGKDGQDGSNGSNGQNGSIGPAGPQGPQGAAGVNGKDGKDGVNGIDGIDGASGKDGTSVTGTSTLNGETLITLSNGSNLNLGNLKGDTGATGATGPRGLQGATGAQGANGIQGIQGLQGPAGAVGPKGQDGNDGKNGLDGNDGTSVVGNLSVNGQTLLVLSNGSNLNLGNLTGAKGDQGIQGLTGSQGPTGLTGPRGINGVNGTNGTDGKDGSDGQDGVSVVKGKVDNAGTLFLGLSNGSTLEVDGNLKGPKGDTGSQGPKGMQGIQGPRGLQGIQGLQGAQGPRGIQGKEGNNGDDGVGIINTQVINGELLITLTNGSTQDAGEVPGIEDAKINSDGILLVKFTDGTIKALGKVTGEKGDVGPQGPRGPAGPAGGGTDWFESSTNLLAPTKRVNSMVSKLEHLTVKNVLHFGGANSPDWEDDSRLGINKDALVVCRVNHGKNKTELRFNIGNDFGNGKDISDTFVVGANSPDNKKFNPIFEVDSEGKGKVRVRHLKNGLAQKKVITTDSEGNFILVPIQDLLN